VLRDSRHIAGYVSYLTLEFCKVFLFVIELTEVPMKSGLLSIFLAAVFTFVPLAVVLSTPSSVSEIPAYSHKYGTSSTNYHVDFPNLNDFGKTFKAGFW